MKVAILGAGAYGLALANTLTDNNVTVNIWTKVKQEYELLSNEGANEKVLPGFRLNEKMQLCENMVDAINDAEIIFVVVASKYLMNTLDEIKRYYNKKQVICIASKGVLQEKLFFMSKIFSKDLNTKKIVILSGGTFAKDMLIKEPMGLMIGTKDKSSGVLTKKSLENEYLKAVISRDTIGIEICGAFKNIFAISLGMIEGLQYNESTKCMFVTKAINELGQMISFFGGDENTILSYAGIGDLWLTGSSTNSRNYTLGLMIGKRLNQQEIKQYISNNTIEGLDSLVAIYRILESIKCKSKFISCLYNIIYNNESLEALKKYLIDN